MRFVQVYSGGGPLVTQWDAHDDINGNHEKMCGHVDKPIAALLKDLKRRGLLKDTLVVWCSEFGRTPNSQGGKGRDHNPLRLHDVAGRRRGEGRAGRSARRTSSG